MAEIHSIQNLAPKYQRASLEYGEALKIELPVRFEMAQGEAVLPINIVAFDPSIVGNDDEKAGIERIDPNSLSLFVSGNFVQERVTYFPQGLLH